MNMLVRSWDPDGDAKAGFAVWNAALGMVWPLTEDAFRQHAREEVVAIRDGRMLGAALVDSSSQSPAITALFVLPEAQGQGTGTALHGSAIGTLHRAGLLRAGLGAGRDYFWPGVPANLPTARSFFERRGWIFEETTWDLARNLRDFQAPGEVIERVQLAGFECRPARLEERNAVVCFEDNHFPQRAPYFRAETETSRMIIAVDADGIIRGSLLIECLPGKRALWSPLLGANAGAIGAVGVAEAVQEQGAGTALVAKACEVLRDAGIGNCHIGWTNLLSFYGRLGFHPWREHVRSRRPIGR